MGRAPRMLRKYSISQVISESIRDRGLLRTLRIIIAFCVDYSFDLRYGSDTFSWVDLADLSIVSRNTGRGEDYVPTKARPLAKVLKISGIEPKGIFVDFGCGKARTLFIAAKFGFREVVGVEFSAQLCEISKANFRKWKSHLSQDVRYEIMNIDAEEYRFTHRETVLYFFNPFDAKVMAAVLGRFADSITLHPRECWVIYNNPVHGETVDATRLFDRVLEIEYGGNVFLVAEARLPEDQRGRGSRSGGAEAITGPIV